jgi:anthranilate phosphoribosyltransferase
VTLQEAIAAALAGDDLTRDQMAEVIGLIMDGEATPAQIGGLLIALRAKGEAVDELAGAAAAMRARSAKLRCPPERSLDTCGTGGDGACTINVSTLAALMLVGCDAVVAKHGNRALSSKCGSADVLEALGVVIDADPAIVERCLDVAGIGFAFAPRFHAATRHASGPRRELGTRTIFNLLGPLTNPAAVRQQVVGVFDRAWCEPMAKALGALGVRRAAVVHGVGESGDGRGGTDEVAVRGETFVALWWDGELSVLELEPSHFGLEEVDPAGLTGGDAAHNASVMRCVLAGQGIDKGEPLRAAHNAGAMTAALALELLEPRATFSRDALPRQVLRASSTLLEGHAALALHQLREASRAPLGADLSALRDLDPDDFAGRLPP